ncbi:MAG: hypothetical protein D6730_24675 [Bacteroidetes bacterium]|nr:MAG: hypothetical protein D6730_24675 [Bacteroidota bacterium]
MGKHSVKITILIIVLLLLLTAIGLLVTGYVHVGGQLHTAQSRALELEKELDELDKYLTDYVVVNASSEVEAAPLQQVDFDKLQEAYNKIEELQRKIDRLKAENKAQKDEIRRLEQRLNELKVKAFNKTSGSMTNLLVNLQQMALYIDTLERQMLEPRQVDENQQLSSDDEAYLKEIQRLQNMVKTLRERLNLITELKAYDFEFKNIKDGVTYSRRYFKQSAMETFQICFSIPGNPFNSYSFEPLDVYLVLLEPDQRPSYNKAYSGMSKGERKFMYSAKTEFVRGRKAKELCISYEPPDGNWKPGIYTAQIICEGEPIGQSKFEVAE